MTSEVLEYIQSLKTGAVVSINQSIKLKTPKVNQRAVQKTKTQQDRKDKK